MDEITSTDRVGMIVARAPWVAEVFRRHDIDFCCGGARSLDEACAERGVAVDEVLSEIAAEVSPAGGEKRIWVDRPLREVIDYILNTYHAALVRDLPRIAGLAEQVVSVHGVDDLERLSSLQGAIEELAGELASHMVKEERVLFPWILQGNGCTAGEPIRVMYAEHEGAAARLARIRELTGGFSLPSYACTAVEALWRSLERLDADLREHIHLENNVLFPRALAE